MRMREKQWGKRCYRTHDGLLTVIGTALIGLGLLLIFLCIPGWAWAALGGAALIVLGWSLIRVGKQGR